MNVLRNHRYEVGFLLLVGTLLALGIVVLVWGA
jgi:hypothetical protein